MSSTLPVTLIEDLLVEAGLATNDHRVAVAVLGADAPVRQADLAPRLSLQRSHVSRAVRRLLAEGWVKIAGVDPDDNRHQMLAPGAKHAQASRKRTPP
ncbi:hypothetical protein AL072_33015 [Azospirillum thiophilum]|uniref:HTH marR-type domain-containing protein n=1 Tax=Azospirillum thiophilum TaxID=528244 RepID=A0AAC8W607_9PROT|nr:MarR family transcriptional regulator [Azospirillum thiophilum]ALG75754.1 hypothetical protein AL072_33015 [Azospirillum thiophilum]